MVRLNPQLGRLRKFTVACASLCAALMATTAHGQTVGAGNDVAAAEALFDQGQKLLEEGNYLEAAKKLRASQKLDPGIGTLFYLADALEKGQKFASAWATFRSAGSLAEQAGQQERLAIARERAQKLRARLSSLTVNVAEEAHVDGLVVVRGTSTLAPSIFGVPVPIDGGTYVVKASAPGYEAWESTVEIADEKAQAVIEVPVLTKAAADEPSLEPATPPSVGTPSSVGSRAAGSPEQAAGSREQAGGMMRGVGFGLGGAGVVGLGVGAYFLADAFAADEDANALCNDTNCSSQEGQELSARSVSSSHGATVGFTVGGAALATGVLLLVLAPDDEPSEPSDMAWTLAPTFGTHHWGMGLGGQW